MKSLTSKILLFLVVALGIYTAVWYTKAHELEKNLHAQIEKAAQDKTHGYQFQYESIERSGYPFDINLALKNPRIKVFGSSAEIRLNGQIIDKFTPLGGLKSIEYNGKTHLVIPAEEGKEEQQFLLEGEIMVESESGSLLPDSVLHQLSRVEDPLNEIWSHLNLANGKVVLNNLKLTDLNENKTALELDHATIRFAHKDVSEKNQTVFLNAIVKGLNSYPTLSYLYFHVGDLDTSTKLTQTFHEALYSKMGKTDLNFDMDLDIPSNKQWQEIVENTTGYFLVNPVPTSKVMLKGSSSGDNFGPSKFDLNLVTNENEAHDVYFSLKVNSESSPTKAYVDALTYAVQETGKAAAEMKAANNDEEKLQELFTKHREDVLAIVPKMNEFGTIKFAHNIDIKTNKETFHTNVKLPKLELMSAPYGGRIHGEAQGDTNNFTATFTFDLIKYKPMIQDLMAYYNRLTKVINVFESDEKSKLKEVSPQLVEKVLTYIREISNKPTSNSTDVEITTTTVENNTQVGTLTLDEFLHLSNELLEAFDKELGFEHESKKEEPQESKK